MSDFNYDKLATMTCEEIMVIVEEKKKAFPDIDVLRERNIQRLAEESVILKRQIQLSYKELMLSFDI